MWILLTVCCFRTDFLEGNLNLSYYFSGVAGPKITFSKFILRDHSTTDLHFTIYFQCHLNNPYVFEKQEHLQKTHHLFKLRQNPSAMVRGSSQNSGLPSISPPRTKDKGKLCEHLCRDWISPEQGIIDGVVRLLSVKSRV